MANLVKELESFGMQMYYNGKNSMCNKFLRKKTYESVRMASASGIYVERDMQTSFDDFSKFEERIKEYLCSDVLEKRIAVVAIIMTLRFQKTLKSSKSRLVVDLTNALRVLDKAIEVENEKLTIWLTVETYDYYIADNQDYEKSYLPVNLW